ALVQSTSPAGSPPLWKLLGSIESQKHLKRRTGDSHPCPTAGTPMRLSAFLSVLSLVLQEAGTASVPHRKKRSEEPHHSKSLSLNSSSEVTDLRNYEDHEGLADFRDPEVKVTSPAPPTRIGPAQNTIAARTPSSNPEMTRPTSPTMPGLLAKLKRIDLSSNFISSIDNDALYSLPALQDLILSENQLAALPMLPSGLELLDVRLNRLQSSGIQPRAFGALAKLQFLFLADNLLDSVPGPLPLSLRSLHLQNNVIETMPRDAFCDVEEHRHTRRLLEDIRLDGNPINLSLFASTYFCLPRLPIGRFT
uniref:Opticin n=1 Tax=Chinchilla lanigera TaxID=34839 RepID=A0A8C2VKD6_CHILA